MFVPPAVAEGPNQPEVRGAGSTDNCIRFDIGARPEGAKKHGGRMSDPASVSLLPCGT
jgi:hypothetical protein